MLLAPLCCPHASFATPTELEQAPPLSCSAPARATQEPGAATEALTGVPLAPAGLPENLVGGIATVMFQLPIARHNYAWAGCMPAGARRRTCARRLAYGSVSVLKIAWQLTQRYRLVCSEC
jgi:hypothetical protein